MKYHPLFQHIAIPFVHLYNRLLYRYEVFGRENIPEGGCVVVANHNQWSDSTLVATALTNRCEFAAMGKKELFEINPLFSALITALGCFPVDREVADIGAYRQSLRVLREGKKLIIFPQGTTHHKDGDEAKMGAARIALKSGVPVLPVYISEGNRFGKKAYVVIGESWNPPMTRSREGYQSIANEMMQRIYALKEAIPG